MHRDLYKRLHSILLHLHVKHTGTPRFEGSRLRGTQYGMSRHLCAICTVLYIYRVVYLSILPSRRSFAKVEHFAKGVT